MASPDELIAACGQPVAGHLLTRGEMQLACTEGRVLETWLTSSMGDSSAGFGFANSWGVTSEGQIFPGYLVFPRPIPPALGEGGSGWEEASEVFSAFGIDTSRPLFPSTPKQLPPTSIPEELLAKLITAPDDDALRRVIADQLSAAGSPRGEFVVVQCDLAARELTQKQRNRLLGAEKRLLEAHAGAWRAELGFEGRCVEFRRGFIEAVHVSSGLAALGEAWKRTPLRELTLAGNPTLAELVTHPLLPRLTSLNLESCEVTPALMTQLAAAPLSHLRVWGGPKVPSLEALADSALTGTLREVELFAPGTYGACAKVLASTPWKQLESLTVRDDHFGDHDAQALAASTTFGQLTTLSLPQSRLGDAGAISLATSPNLKALKKLVLSYNASIADAAALAFADPNHLPALEHLELVGSRLTPPARSGLERRFFNRVKL